VAKTNRNDTTDTRRLLVDQVVSSPYLSKSSRLREMFIYVCGRVLDHSADEIHEQEIGQEVFGRPPDYDTSADNTVRVHASMLRKRVDQYFAKEGSNESLIIEIPRGNYAPVFRERVVKAAEIEWQLPSFPTTSASPVQALPAIVDRRWSWKIWLPTFFALLFATLSLSLLLHMRGAHDSNAWQKTQPTVNQFWSQVFQKNKLSDIVVGDASLAAFQEKTGHTIPLSEYFDRSYLNKAQDQAVAAKFDPDFAKSLLLKRQSNYGDVALLARMTDMAHAVQSDTKVRFARDYSYRELKSDNAILLGNIASNPWIEPFQEHQTLRWKFDTAQGNYYPVDTVTSASDQQKFHPSALPDRPHEGYATLSLFPNLSGSGSVLIISATGGTAMNAALDFLSDEHSMNQLRSRLAPGKAAVFPYFETLIRVGSRNTLPRDVNVVIIRPLHP
jgi:hypothetical protein